VSHWIGSLRRAHHPGTRDEALGLLRGLIECIELQPVENGFEIELTGEIVRLVELSLAEGKTEQAVLDEKTACSVKMVAGARNHRELTLQVPV
jgi:hypothetical protein